MSIAPDAMIEKCPGLSVWMCVQHTVATEDSFEVLTVNTKIKAHVKDRECLYVCFERLRFP